LNSSFDLHLKGGRPATRAAAAAALSLLAGCAGLPAAGLGDGPGARPSQAAVPSPPAASAAAADAQWWARFNDPLLPELIAAARRASPSLASAAARLERARAARVAAGAALLPNVNAVAAASSGRVSPEPRITTTTASAGLQAGWEIDLFGGNAAGQRAAEARLQGARAGRSEIELAVAAETASAYLALRACEAQREQAELDANSRAETARLTNESERAGFTAPADAALVRASAAQARTVLASQRQACDGLIKALVEVSALEEIGLRQRLAAGTAVLPQPAPLAVPALPAGLLAQRPDLIDAERALQAAAADIDRARAAELPQISLSGSIAGASVRAGDAPTSRGATWSIGPLSVSFPLFDGGARSAATTAARAGYDEAVAQYQALVRRAVREVETSLVALASTAERETDAAQAAQDFEASLRATQARQRGGLASLFDLEAARRNAVAAQSALIELKRERAAAWIALYRSLGGGFEPTPNTP
jgi:outer membrane protein, multidrug efflux system